jgi:hypothetical protein
MVGLLLWEPGASSPGEVVRRLTAMQAQEHPYAIWSVGQRTGGAAARSDVDRAFDEGEVLRTHVLRPTWHFVSAHDLRWVVRLSGPRLMARNARRYQELELDEKTLGRAGDVIAEAVAGSPKTRPELAEALERTGLAPEGQRLAYMVMHAELSAVVCSGPTRGRQHTYAAFDTRVPASDGPSGDDALAELAHRYFTTRGPATLKDFSWWSGLAMGDARAGLAGATPTLESLTIDDRTYWFGDDALAPRASRVDLVQCYDEAIISYTQSRDALRGADVAFDVPRSIDGFTHVVLADGRLLGHWRPVPSGAGIRVEVRLAGTPSDRHRIALDEAIDRYRSFAEA